MTAVWQALASNLSVAAMFFGFWAFAQHWLEGQRRHVRSAALGLCMGLGAVASMLMSAEVQPGIHIDLRSALIALAGFFGGPAGAGLAAVITGICQIALAGAGWGASLMLIAISAMVGLAGYLLRRGRPVTLTSLLLLAGAVSTTGLISLSLLPGQLDQHAVVELAGPLILLIFVATLLAGSFILVGSRLSRDRDLLKAALSQAPDFHYVKDLGSRFMAVNQVVAEYHGFARPDEMVGKTEIELTNPDRARSSVTRSSRSCALGGGSMTWSRNSLTARVRTAGSRPPRCRCGTPTVR